MPRAEKMSEQLRKPRIAFCGPIAEVGKPAKGGYEAANRRTIDDLRLAGLGVLELPYADVQGPLPVKVRRYTAGFAGLLTAIASHRADYDVLHLTLLYQKFILAEAALCRLAKGLGKRVLIDIRAGCFQPHYQRNGPLYRSVVDSVLGQADAVAVEGREDEQFARARCRYEVLYLPNFVDIPPAGAEARLAYGGLPIRLVYVGRIVPEKGIEIALQVVARLGARGLPSRLDVIGAGDPAYVKRLRSQSSHLDVTWLGACPPEQVRERLRGTHFFVFATRHFGEGHSNALTEAMAEGVVPVCSAHGFNRSVVADAGEVLEGGAGAEEYASAIIRIWVQNRWPMLSSRARDRARREFSGERVIPRLVSLYTDMAAGFATTRHATSRVQR